MAPVVIEVYKSKVAPCQTIACGFEAKVEKVTHKRYCEVKGVIIYKSSSNKKAFSPSIYPNPSASGIFQIRFENSFTTLEIQVSTMTGKRVMSQKLASLQKNIRLDLSTLSGGMYLVNLIVDGQKLSAKKIIKH